MPVEYLATDLHKVVWAVIQIIFVLIFMWFMRSAASKLNKKKSGEEADSNAEPKKDWMSLFLEDHQESQEEESEDLDPHNLHRIEDLEPGFGPQPPAGPIPGGPPPTPDPIKPKWWGA